jgi:uncharacterized glyoxalase superfamily protein PhnB
VSLDPFDALRLPAEPVAPDTRFAATLRARLAAALATPRPDDLAVVELPPRRSTVMPSPTTPAATTEFRSTITPYVCVARAADAIAWYGEVFDAVETVRYTGDDGRIGHAEVDIAGARLMLSDEYPDYGVAAPSLHGGIAFTLHLQVADVDAVHRRAVAAGARSEREPEDQSYGERSATIIDPFGHRWMIQTTIAHPTIEEIDAASEGFTVTQPPADG